MPRKTFPEPPISLGKAAKKYGIPESTLSDWAKNGRLKVLQRPERKGQPLLVNEESVVLAKYTYKLWLRGQRDKCPLCGEPRREYFPLRGGQK